MKHLDLTVFEPGDMVGTVSKDGKVALFTVLDSGELKPSDNRMFTSGVTEDDGIEILRLTVRTYNCLKREGIHTVGEMAALYDQGEEVMFAIRNFGQKSVEEIGEHVRRLRGEEPAGAEGAAEDSRAVTSR